MKVKHTVVKVACLVASLIFFTGCISTNNSSAKYVNGWYPVADYPENRIEGPAIVSIEDFEVITLDTITLSGIVFINGKLKEDKVKVWMTATENRIGKRIGFVYNDSVIMAPTVNCRIESGGFTINSVDKEIILDIYSSWQNKQKDGLD